MSEGNVTSKQTYCTFKVKKKKHLRQEKKQYWSLAEYFYQRKNHSTRILMSSEFSGESRQYFMSVFCNPHYVYITTLSDWLHRQWAQQAVSSFVLGEYYTCCDIKPKNQAWLISPIWGQSGPDILLSQIDHNSPPTVRISAMIIFSAITIIWMSSGLLEGSEFGTVMLLCDAALSWCSKTPGTY